MKHNKWLTLGLSMALLLTMAACSQQEEEEAASPSPDPSETPVEEVVESPAETEETGGETEEMLTISASFQDEAGAALADATVRFTVDDTVADYLTDENGALTVASLPRTGTIEVSLLDEAGEETTGIVLEVTEGSVTDVAEQEDGSYLVTLLTGEESLSLSFVQGDDGSLTCALDLGGEEAGA